jgi:hypothetical protein
LKTQQGSRRHVTDLVAEHVAGRRQVVPIGPDLARAHNDLGLDQQGDALLERALHDATPLSAIRTLQATSLFLLFFWTPFYITHPYNNSSIKETP